MSVFSLENATTWIEAKRYCRSNKNGQIQSLSTEDFSFNSKLHDIVIRHEKNAVLWTGLKRRTYPEWKGGNFTGSIFVIIVIMFFNNMHFYPYIDIESK